MTFSLPNLKSIPYPLNKSPLCIQFHLEFLLSNQIKFIDTNVPEQTEKKYKKVCMWGNVRTPLKDWCFDNFLSK